MKNLEEMTEAELEEMKLKVEKELFEREKTAKIKAAEWGLESLKKRTFEESKLNNNLESDDDGFSYTNR